MSNPQTEAVELTPRTCRYCREPYLAPKGTRPHACRRCAPTIEDALAGKTLEGESVSVAARVEQARIADARLLDAATGNTYDLPHDGIPF